MHESDFSFSHLESPAVGAPLEQGRHILRGWIWPKPGGHIVDVRARIGHRQFAGIHGFPRADLAVHFQTGRSVALAEFSVVIELLPGRAEVALEALTIEGRWLIFQTIHWQVSAVPTPANVATPSGPLRWHEFGRALQMLFWAQRRAPQTPVDQLAHKLVAQIPYPRDLRHPHLPFHGHLDEPAAITRCGFGRTAVLGHLFHETQPIRRVLATFDLQAWQTIEHHQPTPGLAAFYTQYDQAKDCGLFGIIDAPAQIPNPVSLRLYAELNDGSLHLCSVQRSQLFTNEDEKTPYPPQDCTDFDSTLTALQGATSELGIEVARDAELAEELARIKSDFLLRAPKTLPAAAPLQPAPTHGSSLFPSRLLLASHNLNFEGAPLFLLDLARYYAALGAVLTLLTPEDGPLRSRFEMIGVSVKVIDASTVFAADSSTAASEAIRLLGQVFDFSRFDLVVSNTFTTFWAVHAAKRAGRKVLLYVHESTTPANFYLNRISPAVVKLATDAFDQADTVSFTTASTRRYHLDYGRPSNHRLTRGWIDTTRIDNWITRHPRAGLRSAFRLGAGEWLITNIGTVCDRKGQHIFARAVDLLWRRRPDLAARTRFIMLGGGATPFDATLVDLLAHLGRTNLVIHPATPDYLPYYVAADLFICSTYEESSPRVILEAMTCGVPILSSAAHGIPEQVQADREAVLIPPGDTVALCEGMTKLLDSPELRRGLAARARARVIRDFKAESVLPLHRALACTVAAHQS
jgi:glycosyltransferase involved in cell wall biosynthesis